MEACAELPRGRPLPQMIRASRLPRNFRESACNAGRGCASADDPRVEASAELPRACMDASAELPRERLYRWKLEFGEVWEQTRLCKWDTLLGLQARYGPLW